MEKYSNFSFRDLFHQKTFHIIHAERILFQLVLLGF